MSMYDLDVVSDVVPDVVPHLNGLPSKQFKARIRCGGAANYGPRITEYIAEYYGVFNTAQLGFQSNGGCTRQILSQLNFVPTGLLILQVGLKR